MVAYDENVYADLRQLFQREVSRVEPYKSRRPLTRNLEKRIDYKKSLVRTYNSIVSFFQPIQRTAQLSDQLEIQKLVVDHLAKLKESFSILKLEYEFSQNIYDQIDFDKISQDWSELNVLSTTIDDDDESGDDLPLDSKGENELGEISGKTTNTTLDNTTQTPTLEPNVQNNQARMAQSPEDFMALAHRTINYKFGGDPLALDSFIDAIKLLTSLCRAPNNAICVQYIMTKLEGEAREAIETAPTTTQEIIDQLKNHIKPESSKVIEGRILALRADKTNLTTFSQRAEELAEQYRRSLCNEGYSKDKAKELAIERTVDLCRRSARSGQVKTIVAATPFKDPKEVIAKMIVAINNVKLDKAAAQNTSKHNNFHNKNPHNKSNKPNNGNYHGQQYNNRNSGASTSQNYNNNRQNNGNGNGNRSGRNNNNNQNSRTFYNSNNNSNNRRQNEQPLRYYSGNETNPGNGGQVSDQTP